MKKYYFAEIAYRMTKGHPDWDCVQDHRRTQYFEDVYTYDDDRHFSFDDFWEGMKYDLALIAGGGYETTHVKNLTYRIQEVSESFLNKYREAIRARVTQYRNDELTKEQDNLVNWLNGIVSR